jgi:hypothetical protein
MFAAVISVYCISPAVMLLLLRWIITELSRLNQAWFSRE